jgi:hypothetical protein
MRPFLVLHPAPVDMIPAGARLERFRLVEAETSIEVREDPSDAFEPVTWGIEFGPWRSVLRDGEGYWSPLVGETGGPPADEADLRDFLSAAPALLERRGRKHVMERAFAMTPVLAQGRGATDFDYLPQRHKDRDAEFLQATRGNRTDLDRARGVRRDGREAAAERLRTWTRSNLRLVDGIPHMRRLPLGTMELADDRKGRVAREFKVLEGIARHRVSLPVATPATYAAMRSRRDDAYRSDKGDRSAAWLALGEAIPKGTDGIWTANAAAHAVRAHLDAVIEQVDRKGIPDPALADEAHAVRAALRDAEILALTGSFGLDDLPEALRTLLRGFEMIWRIPNEHPEIRRPDFHGGFMLESDIRRGYLPDALGTLDPEDEAVLDALAALP